VQRYPTFHLGFETSGVRHWGMIHLGKMPTILSFVLLRTRTTTWALRIVLGMFSDEALTALKKAKDKLDLGLISQEEYDKIKAELTPFIK
jgi:hypothetical protein